MRLILAILMFGSLTFAQTTQPALDGASMTINQDGKVQRYRLLAEVAASEPTPTPAPTPTPTATLDAFDLQCVERVAPALVTVHARGLTLDPLTTRYEWDFGDPTSGRNKLPGFSAGHVYDAPGEYVITLRVMPIDQKPLSFTRTVRVEPDERPRVYLSTSSGDDANDGSINNPLKSLAFAGAKFDRDVYLLLRRGETFDVSKQFLSPQRRVRLGAFGDQRLANPIIRYTGDSTSEVLIRCSDATSGLVVENLTFDSLAGSAASAKFLPTCLLASGRQVVVRDVTFLNVSYAINGNAKPTGVLIERCVVPDANLLRRYFTWIQGKDWTIIDNRVANSTIEHCVRGREFERVLIAYNDLANVARPEADDIAKATINLQAGEYAYVAHNALRGPSSIGPLGKADGLKVKEDRSRCYVVENNAFFGSPLEVQHGLSDVMIRNNTFKVDAGRCIVVDGFDWQYGRGVSNIVIDANHGANAGTTGGFLMLTGKADKVTLTNNVYAAPELRPGGSQTANVYVADDDLSSFARIAGNTWSVAKPSAFAQGGVMYVWPTWSDKRGYLDPAKWAAQAKVKNDAFK